MSNREIHRRLEEGQTLGARAMDLFRKSIDAHRNEQREKDERIKRTQEERLNKYWQEAGNDKEGA